jgi:hypothetical protein
VFNPTGTGAELLKQNQAFLDDIVAKGLDVRLATPIVDNAAIVGSIFEREAVFLIRNGFRLDGSGLFLLAP